MRASDGLSDVEAIALPSIHELIAPVLLSVLGGFCRQQISYCYWKSSRRVAAVLAGHGDLDLLVAHEDQHRAATILLRSGFKLFPSVAHRDHPAMASFLGHDERSGRLIHVHLHFRLFIGARLLKNHRLPWEAAILARAVLHPTLPIRMLDPADEALLCVVRSCFELRRTDPVTVRNWDATVRKFSSDRDALAARVDRAALRALACHMATPDLADRICDALYDESAFNRRRRLRRHLAALLAPYRTYGAAEARIRAAWRALLWAAGGLNQRLLHAPRPWNRRAPGGGCVVAVVGIDGSGKTTVVTAMREWLSAEIDVLPIYFGTGGGRPSLFLRPFKLMVPWVTRWLATKPKGASHGTVSDRPAGLVYSVLLTVWAMAVAIEKRVKLRTARRGAERGLVVVADRYPQNEVITFNDGPLLDRLNTVPRLLRRIEAAAYALAHRLPPDLVIKLEVTPTTAARREPNMSPTVIRERIALIPNLAFPGARVVAVNAEQPLVDVIRAVKQEIWRLL